ncbi:MAG TPA: M23 family metallopeptidase [Desulfobacterales bacterium]|nr:M23 family metallopeptidase [Desulfobacterales bacterium]
MARMNRRFKKKRSSFPFFLILLLILAGAGGYIFITYFEGDKPQIASSNFPEYIGNNTPFNLTVSDKKSGLRSVKIAAIQNGKEKVIFSKEFPRQGKDTIGTNQETINVVLNAKALNLKEGKAVLKVEVTDYSFRGLLKGNLAILAHDITIDTKPPRIAIIHSEKYIKPGGAGIVIYRVDDQIKHGVMLNDNYHPGFPLTDGSDSKYIAYIALPYTASEITKSVIIAEDAAGNRTVKPFAPVMQKAKQKKDRINVGDSFLSVKIPEFEVHYPEMEGALVQKYLYANRNVRTMNNQKIHDLCMNPEMTRLWSGKFLRMAGSSRAGFADHRTYYYNGDAIDKQVHLGMDIASTQHAPIKAAGTGKVIFADYLGIYGNMVMLDHGQGVVSLYSHLSQINVAPGDSLSKGDILGNSGKSGMAGGDHLHFSMLINGIFVTPKEWWDQHWIEVTIDGPLADAKF